MSDKFVMCSDGEWGALPPATRELVLINGALVCVHFHNTCTQKNLTLPKEFARGGKVYN